MSRDLYQPRGTFRTWDQDGKMHELYICMPSLPSDVNGPPKATAVELPPNTAKFCRDAMGVAALIQQCIESQNEAIVQAEALRSKLLKAQADFLRSTFLLSHVLCDDGSLARVQVALVAADQATVVCVACGGKSHKQIVESGFPDACPPNEGEEMCHSGVFECCASRLVQVI